MKRERSARYARDQVSMERLEMPSRDRSRLSKYQPLGRWIRNEKRLAIYLRDNFKCLFCGKDLAGEVANITLDHIITKSAGGDNEPTNIFTACRSCNSSRQDLLLERFATGDRIDRIQAQVNVDLAPYFKQAKAILDGKSFEKVLRVVKRGR